ncbi:hypothetical protein [Magnetococcus sp. PR-3]|uniref:hypothetical protein n=1 Tax=Magnetococcus sp. PR-3 TaxID=3120355 RepID=UPI002FCE576A
MKPDHWFKFGLLALLLCVWPTAHVTAQPSIYLPGHPFSAQVNRSLPGSKKVDQGRMLFSTLGLRTEAVRDGQPVVLIIRTDLQKQWLLFPNTRRYIEQAASGPLRPPLPHEKGSLCQQTQQFQCVQMREEMVSGRVTKRWKIQHKRNNRIETYAVLWIDEQLKLPIRERYADGTTVSMRHLKLIEPAHDLFEIPKEYRKMEEKPSMTAQ